ncbi:MAG: GNAT family N-acetyltransferase [Thermomicrobiales bacterium]
MQLQLHSQSDLALMELQTAALYRCDDRGRLLSINEPDGGPGPRFFLGRTRAGNVWRFRHDLPDEIATPLANLLAAEPVTGDLDRPPAGLAALCDVLSAHMPVGRVWMGPAWCFPEEIERPAAPAVTVGEEREVLGDNFAWLADEHSHRRPCRGVLDEGRAVSVCFSSRNTPEAAEAGVETMDAFRGRGYAVAAVAAWATAVRAEGRIPLYSTSWDNLPSRRVASKLGLRLYGADLSIF